MRLHKVRAALALTAVAVAGVAVPTAWADDYSDPQYAYHDQDNLSRSTYRHTEVYPDAEYQAAFVPLAAQTWLEAQQEQVAGLPHGRVYTGLGQLLPGGSVNDPRVQGELPAGVQKQPVHFLARTGARLSGHLWWSTAAKGPRPAVVITTGSIQGTERMYWWAAKSLAQAGFQVLTWDVQGQGRSEGTGHEPGSATPSDEGVPSQQLANFDQGTVDALEFLLSTPAKPYAPPGWSAADVSAARATGEDIDWANPQAARLDRTRVGLAGHSLGATAVSEVQQCSDSSDAWKRLPICNGRSYPVRAVVGWDSLRPVANPGDVPFTAAVPGLNLQADGYFMNPQPTTTAPDPASHLEAHEAWTAAGQDVYSATIRGGSHNEFIQVPFVAFATRYGLQLADWYTLAWLKRYVAGDKDATTSLLQGPGDDRLYPGLDATTTGPRNAWNAHHFSVRYASAFSLRGVGTVVDLRKWVGLSPVGDWAGANRDRVDSRLPVGPPPAG